MTAPNQLHLQFSDSRWPLDRLTAPGILDYFAQLENPFYERDCVNQRVRQQTGTMDMELVR
jgi:hypothetical protein